MSHDRYLFFSGSGMNGRIVLSGRLGKTLYTRRANADRGFLCRGPSTRAIAKVASIQSIDGDGNSRDGPLILILMKKTA